MRLVRKKETGGRTGRRIPDTPIVFARRCSLRVGGDAFPTSVTLHPLDRMVPDTMIEYGNGDRNAAERAAAAAPDHGPGIDQTAALHAVRFGRKPLYDHRAFSALVWAACGARCAVSDGQGIYRTARGPMGLAPPRRWRLSAQDPLAR